MTLAAHTDRIRLSTKAQDDIIDITGRVQEIVASSGVSDGITCVFVAGSTAAVTTVEYEPGLVEDLHRAMDRLYPKGIEYEHHNRWGDGNGHSHVRASLLGPSLTVPVEEGRLVLGTWQQIVLMELDVRPRTREVVVKVLGEK